MLLKGGLIKRLKSADSKHDVKWVKLIRSDPSSTSKKKQVELPVFLGGESKSIMNRVSVVLGSQWGDEGKGKLVDVLAQSTDLCARCQVP
jgi:hypothetical protein